MRGVAGDVVSVGLFIAAIVGAFGYGCYSLMEHVVESDQRECTAECVAAKARPSEKACAFYCAWGRKGSDTDVVPIFIPVQQ